AATGLVALYALSQTASSGRAFANQARDVIEFGRLRAPIEQTISAARGFLITGDRRLLPEIARWHKDLHSQMRALRIGVVSRKERDLLAEIERAELAHQRAT